LKYCVLSIATYTILLIQGGLTLWSRNARDQCIDLLGIDDKGRCVICELKFLRTSIKDTAQDAAEQALNYHRLLCDSRYPFKLHENAATSEIDLDSLRSKDTRIIVAANAKCWSRWTRSRKWNRAALPADIEYYSIDVAPDEFLRQQGTTKKAYIPKLPASGKKWTRVA